MGNTTLILLAFEKKAKPCMSGLRKSRVLSVIHCSQGSEGQSLEMTHRDVFSALLAITDRIRIRVRIRVIR